MNITKSYLTDETGQIHSVVLDYRTYPNSTAFMYGCVTNGYDWSFLRLQNQMLQLDTERFFLNEVKEILGVFQIIIDSYENER